MSIYDCGQTDPHHHEVSNCAASSPKPLKVPVLTYLTTTVYHHFMAEHDHGLKRLMSNKALILMLIPLVSLFILFVSSLLGKWVLDLLPHSWRSLPHVGGSLMKVFLVIFSLAALKLMTIPLSAAGFRGTQSFLWISFLRRTTLIAFLAILGVIIINSIGVILSGAEPRGFKESGLLNMICLVWLWSSFSEEVFVRGFLQSALSPWLSTGLQIGRIRFSLPVLISAFWFAAMHLTLLGMGMSGYFVLSIFLSALAMGLLAAHYREISKSLVPPILAHMLFNVIGGLPLLIKTLVD